VRRAEDLIQRLNAALYHKVPHAEFGAGAMQMMKMDAVAGSPYPGAFEALKRAINEAKAAFGEPLIGAGARTPNGLKPNQLKRGAIEDNSAILAWLVAEAERLIVRLKQDLTADR
jgi:membrane-bound lytic murein transglycosylase